MRNRSYDWLMPKTSMTWKPAERSAGGGVVCVCVGGGGGGGGLSASDVHCKLNNNTFL